MKSKSILGWLAVGACFGLSAGLGVSAFAGKDLTASDLPIEEVRKFSNALNRIKETYVDDVPDKKLISSAISGMLSGLDPHSAYLDEEAFREMNVETRGEFGGLGLEVQLENGLVKVMSPIEDTPAFRAGIKTGDLIFLIDKSPVKGLTLNQAVKKMRGKPGSKVTLSILRKDVTEPLEMPLIREVIRVRSVRSKLIDNHYGFVRITNFQENTVPMLMEQLGALYKKAPLKGLVLDVRNDPGGLLNSAIAISAVFLPENKTVVTTSGRSGDSKQIYKTQADLYRRYIDEANYPEAELKKVPMVVLINGGSASASEIVAGALQDYKRATVMGLQSFGKASVQTIMPLSDKTAIKITTARYYTPNGRSLQLTGVEPDYWVAETIEGSVRKQVREADYVGHLANPDKKDAEKDVLRPEENQKELTTPSQQPKPIRFGEEDDFQLQQAINFFKGQKVVTIEKPVKKAEIQEEDKKEE